MRGIFLVVALLGCAQPQPPSRTIAMEALDLDREAGRFLEGGHPFSGYATVEGPPGIIVERAGFLNGQRHGIREHFYPTGARSSAVEISYGRPHGFSRTWWPNGRLRTEGWFDHGVAQGVHRQWYESGNLFKEMNLVDGQEQGMQRAWRNNGAIYNNYEAKNGRIFGLRRSKLCFQLKEEEVANAN